MVHPFVSGYPYLKSEPPIHSLTNWDVAANGMVIVSFDRDSNGLPDYFTLRVVFRAFYSDRKVGVIASDFPDKLVFYVYQGIYGFYYITNEKPLFYAIDANEDGHWDLIYKDVSEDGVNGNEVFYDSPSGMFTGQIVNF